MGRIGRLIKTEIDKYIMQTVESFVRLNQLCYQYGPSGEDAPPLPEDRIVLIKEDGTGKYCAAGVLTISQGAKPGEKIMYSRSKDGDVQAVIKMLNSGAIDIQSPDTFSVESQKEMTLKGSKVVVNEGGAAAARKEDTVEVEIPANSVVVSVTGGSGAPAVGVKNVTAMKLTGKITSGSDTVEIG